MNNMDLQDGILSALMLDSILVLAPGTEWKGYILGYKSVYFVLLSYIGLALDRKMVQSSNLTYLESDVGAIKWI